MDVRETLKRMIEQKYHRPAGECTTAELYVSVLDFTKQQMAGMPRNTGKKKMYYLSMEFLIGRLLACNLINLGLYDNGSSLAEIEDAEPEPSLGNGGLGRLAACYLDSAATLGLPVDGVGLCYHFGLFRQVFESNKQAARKNPWIQTDSWLEATGKRYSVAFGDATVQAVMRDIAIPGCDSGAGRLHLFDLETLDESLVETGGIEFDKEAVTKNLTLFLYPDDGDEAGQLLRVYQEYFLASAAAQMILEEAEARGSKLTDLDEYVVLQINDTHPSLIIPELVRLLSRRGVPTAKAAALVAGICAYTNHTILAEALEKWPLPFIQKVAPKIVPIIKELDKAIKAQYPCAALAIIDEDDVVHMAKMDMHYGFSVNGVAALHTNILKESELADFYKIYPQKFNNKTNGISFRRWLLAANPPLAKAIEMWIGPRFKQDAADLKRLLSLAGDALALESLIDIKQQAKRRLAAFLQGNAGVEVDVNSVFDIQIKRLHEYKRQQLNALWLIRQYLAIKAGKKPVRPVTMIFGGKAAPAYVTAQDIIHLILCMQQLVNGDPDVNPWLKVAMVENYNVSAADKLFPACDISEQISLASKEASGTGNMKFMLNGAVTLGTMDGANVEIAENVGEENIYIFGESSDKVIELYADKAYDPLAFYQEDSIGRLVDFIVSRELVAIGDRKCLARLHRELIAKDWFMTLLDAESYFAAKDRALADYENRLAWAKKMLANIAGAGFFSSDRAVAEYERDIWRLR